MKLTVCGETLRISEIEQLRASNSEEFRKQVLSSFAEPICTIDVDLSKTDTIDSSGLGALISLSNMAARRSEREVIVRLIDPTPSVQQILELTRLCRLLEIVRSQGVPGVGSV